MGREHRVDVATDDAFPDRGLRKPNGYRRQLDTHRIETILERDFEKESRTAAEIEEAPAVCVRTDRRQTASHRGELELPCADVVAVDTCLVLGVNERCHLLQLRLLG